MYKRQVIHYVNQFYGQIGGEDKANQGAIIKKGAVGPGLGLLQHLKDDIEIVATIICGDNYFAENSDEAKSEILELIKDYEFDGFIAGPAFNAGRYGIACGSVCEMIHEQYSVPVITAMYPENPGAELYNKHIYILKCGKSAAGMKKTLEHMSAFFIRLLKGEEIGFPEEEGYIPQGRRVNVFEEKVGAVRAVDMLLKKMKGEKFVTELPMPIFDKVAPALPIDNIREATIALVTSGGIVPMGNPDHLESANASKFIKYDISGVNN